jgi:site-specific DNA-adenine methylase
LHPIPHLLGSQHFGNSEVRWLDNLLYLYTQPFDIVVDPFAGGGSTIDVCKKRFRRYWVSDRKPPA